MADNQLREQERREARRKRRIRNQILVYMTLIILILVAALGVVSGVKWLAGMQRDAKEEQEDSQAKIEEIFSDESDIQIPEPTPTPVPELTPEERLDDIVNAGIEAMPLEDKVAGLFLVTPESITGVQTVVQAGEGTQNALAQYPVGGLIYFQKNIQSEEQIRQMLENTRMYAAPYPLFLAVDEEGGSVARVASAGIGTPVDSASAIGATGDTGKAYEAGTTIGSTLSSLGFNLDLAPVADLASVENSFMAQRVYGKDAATAAPFVTAMIQGLMEQNVTPCLKHFPGNGATSQDVHTGQAVSDRTLEQFQAEEFSVFQAGIDAGAPMVMVSLMAAPALTGSNEPCALSSEVVTGLLRGQLGFNGVVITDALNMSAVSEYYAADEAAILALKAGCDMLLMPEDFEKAYNGVLQAVRDGVISEERVNDSLRRIYRIKYADRIAE